MIPNGVLLINTDSHKVAFANKEMISIVGIPEDAMGSAGLADIQERI